MEQNLSLKINVKDIDKAKLFVGDKGVYLDATIIMRDENDQYGNIGMIVQNTTEEEQAKGIKGKILGNARIIVKKEKTEAEKQEAMDDLPF
jgi:hypothetical protein